MDLFSSTLPTWEALVLAGGLATGVLIIFLAYARVGVKPTGAARLKQLKDSEQEAGAMLPNPQAGAVEFARIWKARGLARALRQADLNVAPAAFLRVGLAGTLGGFALTYALLGGVLTAVLAGVIIFFLYLRWLINRRDRRLIAYEEALADAAASMAVGARLGGGTVHGAVSNAARYAPKAVAADLEQVSRRLVQGQALETAFRPVQERRQSPMLNILVSTLAGWDRHGSDRPLGEVLEPLTETIRENAAARKKAAAELTGVRTQMQVLAAAPFVLAALMRFTSLDYARFYSSFWGEVTMMGAFLLSLTGVVIGERMLNEVNQILDLGEV